jgi:hypothetical protein
VGTRTRRSDYIINQLRYSIGCALATRRSICVVRTWLRHLIVMSHSRLIRPLPLSQTVKAESRIFRVPCRHCPSAMIIEPQMRMLRTLRGLIVYPDYRATILPVALIIKPCYDVVVMMVAHALTSDTLELVLAWIVVGRSSP